MFQYSAPLKKKDALCARVPAAPAAPGRALVLEHPGGRLAFTLIHSRRRSLEICLDPRRGVLVRAPLGTSAALAQDLLRRKLPWVLERLPALEAPAGPRPLAPGQAWPHLGQAYPLEIVVAGQGGRPRVQLGTDSLRVLLGRQLPGATQELALRRALETWYRSEAARLLPPRAGAFAQRLGLAPPPVLVRDQKRRWGSCDAKGTLRLNWRLVLAPLELIDYVAAHEVCHLKVPNHSPAFWGLLASLLPDCRQRRQRLNHLGPSLYI